MMKVCKKCGEEKPATVEFFSKNKQCKMGIEGTCKACACLRSMNWEKNNPDRKRVRQNEYRRKRRSSDAAFRIQENCRTRMWNALRGSIKAEKTFDLIGCSREELKSHLESLFEPWMNWDNYGRWEIDHIIPCASFDLTDPIQQKKCFHYSNLQPLCSKENKLKGSSHV